MKYKIKKLIKFGFLFVVGWLFFIPMFIMSAIIHIIAWEINYTCYNDLVGDRTYNAMFCKWKDFE